MIKDFHSEKRFQDIYDHCIIGGGPAGIVLALRLASYGWRVVLAEGGGLDYSERSQALYRTETSGLNAYLDVTRQRFLGGTSNHWAGRCRPFDPSDFYSPPSGELPGWPIPISEIDRYMPEAMRILDLPPDTNFKAVNTALTGEDFNADRFLLSSPTRFAEKFSKELRGTKGLDVFINCNCVDLEFDSKTKRLAAAVVSDYSKRRGKIAARNYILAMGAVENARQLLNSNSLASGGVIHEDGLVGSCFMEHLNVDIGSFMLKEGLDTSERQYYTSDVFVAKHRTGKGNTTFSVVEKVKSYGRTAAIKDFFKNLACNAKFADKVKFVSRFDCPGDGDIGTLIEQVPNGRSRISLLDATDELGVRKANVHWEISPEDIRTIKTIGIEVAKQFADTGLGYVKLNESIYGDSTTIAVHPHAHHMGTTRMAATPIHGVVDENCKVFDTRNLYVAGSSIFSRGGACNPTMPILQFTLRLADHLHRRATN